MIRKLDILHSASDDTELVDEHILICIDFWI